MRGEREHWVLVCVCFHSTFHLFTENTHQWRVQSLLCDTALCSSPLVISFLEFRFLLNSSPAHRGASLHCGWDTVAAPVADVSRKRRRAISHPIGHSPLFAIINSGCAWKKMIMGALSSLQQLSTNATGSRLWLVKQHCAAATQAACNLKDVYFL